MVQLNAQLPKTLAKRVKSDAVRNNVSLGEYTEAVFHWFLDLPMSIRRRSLLLCEPKRMGRRIKI